MKKLRQSRVEPVFCVLTQYLGLRKINTRGLEQANKAMLMSAKTYNLKKLLKYSPKKSKSGAGVATFFKNIKRMLLNIKGSYLSLDNIDKTAVVLN